MCNKVFRKIDIFGGTIGLYYKGEDSYKSTCGGICTVFYILIMAAITVSFFVEWLKQKPTITKSTDFDLKTPVLNISSNQLVIGFEFHNTTTQENIEIPEIKKILDIKYFDKNKDKKDLFDYMVDCTDYKEDQKMQNSDLTYGDIYIFEKPDGDKKLAICTPPNSIIKLKGAKYRGEDPKEEDFIFDSIDIYKCSEDCDPEMEEKLSTIAVSVVFLEGYLERDKLDNPVNYVLNYELNFPIRPKEIGYKKIILNKKTIVDNQGYILNEIKTYDMVELEYFISEDYIREDEPGEELSVIEISYSNKNLKVERNYEKIQDMIGKVGGFASIVTTVITLSFMYFKEHNLKSHIYKKNIFRQYRNKEVTSFKLFKLNWECFQRKQKGKDKKIMDIYLKGKEEVDKGLEISNVVKLHSDVIMLKHMLLNKHQRILMEIGHDDMVMKGLEDEFDLERLGDEELRQRVKDAEGYIRHNMIKERPSMGLEDKVNDFLRNLDPGHQEYGVFGIKDDEKNKIL